MVTEPTEPRWYVWGDHIFKALVWFMVRGGLLAAGAGLLLLGYSWGFDSGSAEGFSKGCRAGIAAEECDKADRLGLRIHSARMSAPVPGHAKDDSNVAYLCEQMPFQAAAEHFGCPD